MKCMTCKTNKKDCPLQDPKNLMIAGICAAVALLAVGAAIGGWIVARRRKKARMEPIIFQPPVVTQPTEDEEAGDDVLE